MSLRVLSGIGAQGVIVLRAVLYLPFPGSISSQQGLKCSVDIHSGQLGKVFSSSVDQRFLSVVPATQTRVEGMILPFWPQVLALVTTAHEALDEYAYLGWDLAITSNGPVVLEANGNFATDSLQKPGARPLIDDDFLAVFNHWARRQNVGRPDAPITQKLH